MPASADLPDIVIPPGGFYQINEVLKSNGLSLASGYVRVERVNGLAPYYAYAVINNQLSSDGSFVPPPRRFAARFLHADAATRVELSSELH